MKNFTKLSLALLCVLFACETEPSFNVHLNSQPFFIYDTDVSNVVTESYLIDFENFDPGDIVSEILIDDPFENAQVEGITLAFPNNNAAMVFDSSNPSGGDFDIGTPNELYGGPGIGAGGVTNDTALGNVLILSEDLDSSDPDDIFEIGASFFFDYSENESITLNSFDILDIEESSNPTVVNLYDISGNIIFSDEVEPGGDNSKSTVDLFETTNVAFMEIIMNSSGAIDNIALEMEIEEPCVDCDSAISELTIRYNGQLQDAPLRVETIDGVLVFEGTISASDEFSISTNEDEGTLGVDLLFFINDEQVSQIATDCSQVIGPGYITGDLEVVSGTTETGGQLCPVSIAF
ncbi:DUF7467 domain-containing protein [Winogradskyella poriferorum]|uniref:DUF7467 domain-containing protein n=1 Tax=Winogradskyella poriferorum TaxID=307627 RepID=UPI003D660ECC